MYPGPTLRMASGPHDLAVQTSNEAADRPGLTLVGIYREHFHFVWRTVRRLGVPPASVDDAVQDVFVVVHRRLRDFEARSSVKTWLFGIALRVAKDHRRALRRKGGHDPLGDDLLDHRPGPVEMVAQAEAVELLDRLLDRLSDERRAVFVLAELEQMTAPEIAEALGVGVNTVYSRLRAARADFEAAVAKLERRQP
jgi:RNA polymerase sigma-70 factor, ECF subfamily